MFPLYSKYIQFKKTQKKYKKRRRSIKNKKKIINKDIFDESILLWNTTPKKKKIIRSGEYIDLNLLESGKGCFIQGWTKDCRWWNYGLVYDSFWVIENLMKVPKIYRFLSLLPDRKNIIVAGVSVLDPGASIPFHYDEPEENRDKFRVEHYGLFGKGNLYVNKIKYNISPGKYMTFNDADYHKAENMSNKNSRGILYIKYKNQID